MGFLRSSEARPRPTPLFAGRGIRYDVGRVDWKW